MIWADFSKASRLLGYGPTNPWRRACKFREVVLGGGVDVETGRDRERVFGRFGRKGRIVCRHWSS